MRRCRIHSRMFVGLMLATAALAAAPNASAKAQGLTYDMKMSLRKGVSDTAGEPQIMMSGHGKFSDGNSRMDMDESIMPGGFMGKGTYMIVRSGTRNEWIVEPDKQQYIEINVDSAANFSAGSMNLMGLVKMETSGVTVDMVPMGPGETIQGYTTMKYRVTSHFTSTTSIFGRKKRSKNSVTTDIWMAPRLAGLYNPASSASQGGGGSELGQKMRAAYAKMGKGAVLKTVSQTQSSGDHAAAMTATMELLNIKQARVSPSAFEVPRGYAKIDGTAALSILGGGGNGGSSGSFGGQIADSAKQGVKQGVAAEVKDQAKAKAKGLLHGIFGRP